MDNCLFCQMVQGQIPTEKVVETESYMVIKDIRPKAAIHLLLIPKTHVDKLSSSNAEHLPLLGHILEGIRETAKSQNLTDYRVIMNNGEGGGQEIFHWHFHLLSGDQLPGF